MTLLEYKKAALKYTVMETYAAGLELLGTEVKSIRAKLGSLDGSRVVVRGGEAYIVGMTIPPYQAVNAGKDYEEGRNRRLLLTKSEIRELAEAEDKKGLTIVPLLVYTSGRYVKAKIAIVKGKSNVDRREDIKKRDADRESRRTLKRQ